MTKHTARKALAIAALVVTAGLGLTPGHASAEDKKPPKTLSDTGKPPKPYMEIKLVDIFIASV